MGALKGGFAMVALALAITPARAGEKVVPADVLVVTSHGALFRRAAAAFDAKHGPGRLRLVVSSEAVDCAQLKQARAVFVDGGFWSEPMNACRGVVAQMAKGGAAFSGTMAMLIQTNWGVPPSPRLNEASAYLQAGGADNMDGFLALMHNAAGGLPAIPAAKLAPSAPVGIYHPDAPSRFASLEEYEKWRGSTARPRVGILFFKQFLDRGEPAAIDALIRALERRGLEAMAVYGWPLKPAERFFARQGQAVVETLLLVDPVMPSPDNAAFLARYRLHAINLMTTSQKEDEWRAAASGLPPGRLPVQVGNAERSGVTEPILIAAATDGGLRPIAGQVELAAARASRWVALRTKPNHEKRVALVYFNNPPGKATLGASYLDLVPSLSNVVERLKQEGYVTGGAAPDAGQLMKLLQLSGRNVGEYAQGEVEALVRDGHAQLLPVGRYEEWFKQLPAAFQRDVLKAWGPAAESKLMTVRLGGRAFFVMPGVRLGNLWLAPQPLRAAVAESGAKTHDVKTPPPHSYIAAYLWLRFQVKADAMVHFGRHGTLEWLPGKDVAQQERDAGQALVGDLPHAYYYLVDGGGEFLQAKRRSSAVILSHLTPMLGEAGLPSEYRELKASLENYERTREASPQVAAEHAQAAWAEARKLKLQTRLQLQEDEAGLEKLAAHLHDLEEQAIPLGLHRIGSMPGEAALRDAVSAYLKQGALPNNKAEVERRAGEWATALVAGAQVEAKGEETRALLGDTAEWLKSVRESPAAELQGLVDVLNGRFVGSGVSGDPLRAAGAVPTGRNLHDQDPRGFPSKAAYAAGERLAGALIEQYRSKHGAAPRRVSFVLWYGESGRTQGLQEAQALALLGVRPVWNGRGQVSDVELRPLKELGRPRVDVVLTMSGLYRDGMPEKLPLLDKAVRLVREAAEDNAVQANTIAVESELVESGVGRDDARKAARARVFGPRPGAFGVGMAGMMESSQDAGDAAAAARKYLGSMNYAYGDGLEGAAVEGALRTHLKRNEVVVHGRSSNLYGLVDNDETYQFAGGLNAATREASGRAPEFLIANARRAGSEKYEEAGRFLRRELTTRLWNEKWIEGMKASGYAGAQEMARQVENLYGFRATAPEQVDAEVWQETYETYVADKRRLGLAEWFKRENPHARQMLAARLIEIDRQGVYRFSDEDRRRLVADYVKSVNESGVSCYVNACGNKRLARYVAASARGLAAARPEEVRAFEAKLAQASASTMGKTPRVERGGVRAALARLMKGVRIFEVPADSFRVRHPEVAAEWLALLLPVPFGLLLGAMRRRMRPAAETSLGLQA